MPPKIDLLDLITPDHASTGGGGWGIDHQGGGLPTFGGAGIACAHARGGGRADQGLQRAGGLSGSKPFPLGKTEKDPRPFPPRL